MPPAIAAAVIGGVAALGDGLIASSGASHAANDQVQADQQAVGEQQREFNINQANFAPFLAAGNKALGSYGDLVGSNGNAPQQSAITALQNSPYYQSLYRNGQQAVLQNASATGGLRGGNTQLSLANFGADTLAQTIQQQLANLSPLAQMGLSGAGASGQLGQSNANAISSILADEGSARAGSAATQAGIFGRMMPSLASSITQALFPNLGQSPMGAPPGAGLPNYNPASYGF